MFRFIICYTRLQKKIILFLAILLFTMQFAYIYNNLLFNLWQLGRIHQNKAMTSLLLNSLEISPNNIHIRLQTATFFAEEREFDQSIKVLMPLSDAISVDPKAIQLLLNLLVTMNRGQEAWAVFQKTGSSKLFLTPGVSAEFVRLSRNGAIKTSPDILYLLLLRALGLDSASAEIKEVLGWRLEEDRLWDTEFGAKLLEGIIWRSYSLKFLSPIEANANNVCSSVNSTKSNRDLFTTLAKNQINNSNFESYNVLYDTPEHWKLQLASTGYPWNVGAFITGIDHFYPISGFSSLRVDSLLVEWKPERENARANVISSPITIEPNSTYAFCFIYRTKNAEDYIASFLPTENYAIFHQQDIFLPATQNNPKMVTIIVHSDLTSKATINSLFRVWKEGTIWIDDFSVQRVILNYDKAVRLPVYYIDSLN